jgi:hypothetical protein
LPFSFTSNFHWSVIRARKYDSCINIFSIPHISTCCSRSVLKCGLIHDQQDCTIVETDKEFPRIDLPFRLPSHYALSFLSPHSSTPTRWISRSTLALGEGRQQTGWGIRVGEEPSRYTSILIPTGHDNSLAGSAVTGRNESSELCSCAHRTALRSHSEC